jgi:Fe-S-cluster containining protein
MRGSEVEFQCQQCGKCCKVLGIKYHIYASEEDVCRWDNEGREDILQWVDRVEFGEAPEDCDYDFGIHPVTGEEVIGRCPFLRKVRLQERYICMIQDTKPANCRAFPTSPEKGAVVGCPGLWQ